MLNIFKRKFREFQRIVELLIFPRWQNIYWRWRHICNPNWAQNYLNTIYHPHRNQIIEAISKFQSVNSIAEIGCASGANIYRLVDAYPKIRIIGVDISFRAIKVAKQYFEKNNKYKNVKFYVSKADDLSIFENRSIDVLLTDAMLMFVAPDLIEKTLSEIISKAKLGIVMNEFCISGSRGNFESGHWIYDLVKLIKKITPKSRVTIKKSSFNGDASWDSYGHLIIVHL